MCRTERPPKVFISYSHDSDAHKARVLALADRLRVEGGIESIIDRYVEPSPELGWATWCWRQIEEADFILMLCTAAYSRRVSHKEEAGKGHGVCWEAPLICQLLYDQGSTGRKFVPCLLNGGIVDDIPLPVRKFGHFRVEDDDGWRWLLHHLHGQQPIPEPAVCPIPKLSAQPRAGSLSPPVPPPPAPQTQAGRLFVGRHEELATLRTLLLGPADERLPVVVCGMPGVGKSYLVDRFYIEHRQDFPGGYIRVALDPGAPASVEQLLAQIAAGLSPPLVDPDFLRMRLLDRLVLVHVENIDTCEAAAVAGRLADCLAECLLVFSARFTALSAGTGWGELKLEPHPEDLALDQLQQELQGLSAAPSRESLEPVARAFGGLPLALHLAAGYLRTGETVQGFLRLLARKGLELPPVNPADPSFRERKRLSATFSLSIDALKRDGGSAGTSWRAGFESLGWGAAAGFGDSLGAAIAGLDADTFDEMVRAASRLSLLDRRSDTSGITLRLHPLLAELGRARADKDAAIARITDWFCERLPEPAAGAESRWNEVHAETAALLEWLPLVPAAERVRVIRAGSAFAIITGPFHAWRRFCEAALENAADDADRSDVLWTLGNVSWNSGEPDEALRRAEEKQDLDRSQGNDRETALAAGLITDILQARGQLDAALRIHQEKQLPVFERLGDVRSRAATMGKIADILQTRGQLGAALRIRQEEELPVYERFGDVRSRAVTIGKIADILQTRGQLDAALRIRREEQLPVYECLGDVHSRAVTMGKIADILQARGQLDEALRIREEEELPVYERLGDVRWRAVTMGKIAGILQARGQIDEALRIRQEEELRIYERLGDVRELLVSRANTALTLLMRNNDGDWQEAQRLLCLALVEAQRLRLPEAGQITEILQEHGLSCGQ